MFCPRCQADDTKVVDSRLAEEGVSIRRRRQCLTCSYRFTTFERAEELALVVRKSDGTRQEFDREKVLFGVLAAIKGRSVEATQVDRLATEVEHELRSLGGEVTTSQIGLSVLDRLRVLDEVAYLRFASVYKNFDAAADFASELALLSKLAEPSG